MTDCGKKLFEAQLALMAAESEVDDAVARILGFEPDTVLSIGYDYYDESLEIHGVPPDFVCTPEQVAAVKALGVSKFWTHVGDELRAPGQKAYL